MLGISGVILMLLLPYVEKVFCVTLTGFFVAQISSLHRISFITVCDIKRDV